MADGQIVIDVILNDGSVAKGIANIGQLGKSGEKAGISIGKIAGALGVFKLASSAINVVKSSINGAITRIDTLNNSQRVFENMGFSAKDTNKAMEDLKASIQGLPTPLDGAVKGVQLLASSTNDVGKAQKIFSALNNGILGFGGTTAQVENAVTQLSQAFSNGKVDAETWNSMIDSGLGPALNALAKQMGITTGELKSGLSDGSISVEKFQNALINLNEKGGGGLKSLQQIAKDSTAGIGTGIANMKTAVVRGLANIIGKFDELTKKLTGKSIGENITAASGMIDKAFEAIVASMDKIIPVIQSVKENFGTVANVIKPLMPLIIGLGGAFLAFKGYLIGLSVISTVTKALGLLNTAFTILSTVGLKTTISMIMGFMGPIGWIITAIGAVVAAVVYLWNTNEGFRNAVIAIWEAIKSAFVTAKDAIVNAWAGVQEFFSNLWTGITEGVSVAIEAIKTAWSAIVAWFVELWATISQTAVAAWAAFSAAASAAWTAIVNAIMIVVQPFVAAFMNIWNGIRDGLTLIWQGIQLIAQGAWEMIKAVIMGPVLVLIDLLTGDFTQLKADLQMIWNSIKSAASSIWNGIKTYFSGVVSVIVGYVKAQFQNMKAALTATWNAVKSVASSTWNAIKSAISNAVTSTINSAKSAWNGFKAFLSSLWSGIKSTASSAWNGLKSSVLSIIRGIVSGAQSAWNSLKQGVSNVVSAVKGIFNSLANINLASAGRAIINGFLGGIKSAFEGVKSFVGGIASWIREHKGPISYDKRLLIPAGKAIMQSLDDGLRNQFSKVQRTISNMAGQLQSDFEVGFKTNGFNSIALPNVQAERVLSGAVRGYAMTSQIVNNTYNNQAQVQKPREIVIKVPVNIDGRQTGYATARYVEEENNRVNRLKNRLGGKR